MYQSNLLGLTYDYDSIMHYGWNYFAKDRKQPTIVPKTKANIGNRKVMSPTDVQKINILYQCAGSNSGSPSGSSSGGRSRPSSSGSSGGSSGRRTSSSSGHRSIWDILLGSVTGGGDSGSSSGSSFQSATSPPRRTTTTESSSGGGVFGFLHSIFG